MRDRIKPLREPGVDTEAPDRLNGPVTTTGPDEHGRFTSDDPATPHTVITQHEPDGAAQVRHFPTYEDAKAWTNANNPDTDGSMRPNVDQSIAEHPEYNAGAFWPNNENRYAAIHKRGLNGYDPAQPAEPIVPHVTYDGPPVKPKPLRRDKVMDRYGIRVTHNKIPADSEYHMAAIDGTYPSGGVRLVHKRGDSDSHDVITSEPDVSNLSPVTPDPEEMDRLSRYADLIDRNTGESLAYTGWDPEKDMVFVQDPENGNESWVPRKQLIVKHLPDDPYSHGRRDG